MSARSVEEAQALLDAAVARIKAGLPPGSEKLIRVPSSPGAAMLTMFAERNANV
jgi:hypothetical protein